MLQARKPSIWKNRYEISCDGRPLTAWDGSFWKSGGTFELDGRHYEVRGNLWGSKYGMATSDGARIATADHVGRKRWTVEADGRTYEFRRPSIWRHEQQLLTGGQPVGSIDRTSVWRSDAVADLPGLPLPLQVFVLAVVLTMWDDAASASTAGTGAVG